MQVCQEALELNGSLISTDQLLYHDELKNKFQQMQSSLGSLLDIKQEVKCHVMCEASLQASQVSHLLVYPSLRLLVLAPPGLSIYSHFPCYWIALIRNILCMHA